jgi:hypothetical protein
LIYAYLKKISEMIPHFDITMAGTALTFDSPLVTKVKHFTMLCRHFGLKPGSWAG